MISCPYCDKPFPRSSPERFAACPNCGYRSAHIDGGDRKYLIIDSLLPDLIAKYKQLLADSDELVVLIDRRISHNQVAGNERRRPQPSTGNI